MMLHILHVWMISVIMDFVKQMKTRRLMMVDKLRYGLQIFCKSDDFYRFKFYTYRGHLSITVDVHGLSCKEAYRLINNIINYANSSFGLVVIHGFNHGTAIKDMLANSFNNPNIEIKYVDPYNPGITYIHVA